MTHPTDRAAYPERLTRFEAPAAPDLPPAIAELNSQYRDLAYQLFDTPLDVTSRNLALDGLWHSRGAALAGALRAWAGSADAGTFGARVQEQLVELLAAEGVTLTTSAPAGDVDQAPDTELDFPAYGQREAAADAAARAEDARGETVGERAIREAGERARGERHDHMDTMVREELSGYSDDWR